MLSLYYSISGYVSGNSRKGTWGIDVVNEIRSRLREEFPGVRGFSPGNIKLISQFFEAWRPYLQINTELFLESKSVATAINLEQTDAVALTIQHTRPEIPHFIGFPVWYAVGYETAHEIPI